jgi:hypothetical protein
MPCWPLTASTPVAVFPQPSVSGRGRWRPSDLPLAAVVKLAGDHRQVVAHGSQPWGPESLREAAAWVNVVGSE